MIRKLILPACLAALLMTACTTVFGLFPMVLAEPPSQGIHYRALGTCVAGGLAQFRGMTNRHVEDPTVTGAFAAAGSGFVDATLQTDGVTDGDLRLRVPTTLSTTLLGGRADLIGCDVAVGPSPLWRYFDRAQATAMDTGEIAVSCPISSMCRA